MAPLNDYEIVIIKFIYSPLINPAHPQTQYSKRSLPSGYHSRVSRWQIVLNNCPSNSGIMTEKDINAKETKTILKDEWAIRPCEVYNDEYDDCTSFKARFHQYFVNGENTDCTQWKTDYKNCIRYRESNGNDVDAGVAVITSEEERRLKRFHGHYANNVWEKRKSPPEDWSKPLPEWLEKKNENTYLQLKQLELEGKVPMKDEKSYCSIM